MTTNLNRSQSKTRDRHAGGTTRRSQRPSPDAGSAGTNATQGTRSQDEIRETVKEAVGKGVAAVAGAVEGVADTMEETQLADTAEQAVRQVGQTANKVVAAAKEETTNLKQALSGEGKGSMDEDEEDPIGKNDPTFAGGGSLGGTLGRSTYESKGSSSYGSGASSLSGSSTLSGSSSLGGRGSAYDTEASTDGSPLGQSASRSVTGSSRDEDDEDEPIGL